MINSGIADQFSVNGSYIIKVYYPKLSTLNTTSSNPPKLPSTQNRSLLHGHELSSVDSDNCAWHWCGCGFHSSAHCESAQLQTAKRRTPGTLNPKLSRYLSGILRFLRGQAGIAPPPPALSCTNNLPNTHQFFRFIHCIVISSSLSSCFPTIFEQSSNHHAHVGNHETGAGRSHREAREPSS